MTKNDDMFLTELFAEARDADLQVPQHLMARVLIDADEQIAATAKAAQKPQQGLWSLLMTAIGGWPAVGGLAMAGVAGIWVGYAPPTGIPDIANNVWGDAMTVTVLDVSTDYEDFFYAE